MRKALAICAILVTLTFSYILLVAATAGHHCTKFGCCEKYCVKEPKAATGQWRER
jgi:hypothetical protein